MMYPSFGAMSVFGPLVGLGHLFVVGGVILLIAWAIKHLHGEKLKQTAVWCIAIGIVLCLVGVGFGMTMMGSSFERGGFMMEKF